MSQKQPTCILITDNHPVVRAGLAAIARDCQSAVGDTTNSIASYRSAEVAILACQQDIGSFPCPLTE